MFDFTYKNATTIAEAATALAGGKAQVIAGNTDLSTYMKGMFTPNPPTKLVNINHVVPSLSYIKVEGGTLKIGALTKLTAIATSADVKGGWAALAQAALAVGSPELRNMGTIAGNICQKPRCIYYRNEYNAFPCLRKVSTGTCYAIAGINRFHSIFGAVGGCIAVCPSDTAPALVALGASIVTNKKTWAAADFFVVPTDERREQINNLAVDEIVTEIQIPALAAGSKSAYLKFAFRKAIDFPLVSCATVATISGGNVTKASIVLGGVHNSPRRATEAETSITGKAISATTAEAAGAATAAAATAALPATKYKVQIAKTLIKRSLLASA